MKQSPVKFSTLVQVAADFGTLLIALYLSYWLWELSPFRLNLDIIWPTWLQAVLVSLLFILLFYLHGGYERKTSILNVRARKNLISAMLLGCALVIVYSFFTRRIALGRLQVFYLFILMLLLITLQRHFFDRMHTMLLRRGIGARRVLIFGAGDTGERIARALQQYPKMGYLPVGFIDDYKKSKREADNPLPILGSLAELRYIIKETRAEEMIIAIPSAPPSRMQEVMRGCDTAGLPYRYVPNLYDTAIQRIRTEVIDGVPVFGLARLHYSPVSALVKRLFDLVISVLVILVCAPLVLLIGMAIRLETPGPVIFKHLRTGKGGKSFLIWKFRTMHLGTDPYAVHPQDRRDPRITRVGRVLRRTSLDELPQFWNVLRGDMSIVGPRPEMPFIVANYTELQRERLNVRPGITGLWQISADRAVPIHENIDHDLFYIQNQSLLLDLIIIAKTFWVAVAGLGK
ncbi:MAG TPA: sugar transferase [bacterium]|nr:sugar transferase [bacterium]HQG46244.1 sugar transferase [bacterium]HQJ65929.1 sugar transferase [bacterium]